MNIFHFVDLFGKKIDLNFNGSGRATTRVGGIFTFLLFGFAIWSTYHVSQDLFSHSSPQTISSESFSENPDPMVLGPDTFTLGFGLQTPDTFEHYIDESIYTVEVRKTQAKRTTNSDGSVSTQWTRTPLRTERCTTSHFGELASKFADIELPNLFCFAPTQPTEDAMRIQGVFESPMYEYITVFFKECDEATSAVPCADAETRRRLLQGGFFATYFTNMAFDPKHFEDPVFRYRDSQYTTFGNNYYKEVTAWLSHVQVTSDSGWLTEELETTDHVKFENLKELFTLRDDMGSFLDFVVRVGKITTKNERSYIKVQDIIAEVNGLLGVAMLAIALIVAPYTDLKFYEGLINELFDIKMKKHDKDSPKNGDKSLIKNLSIIDASGSPSAPMICLSDCTPKNNQTADMTRSPLNFNSIESPVNFGSERSPLNFGSDKSRLNFNCEDEIKEIKRPRKLSVDTRKKKAIFSRVSIHEDTYPGEMDEKNGGVAIEVFSAELGKNPFNKGKPESQEVDYKPEDKKFQKFKTLAKSAQDVDVKIELVAAKLRVPSEAAQGREKITKNNDQKLDSVDLILESFEVEKEVKFKNDTTFQKEEIEEPQMNQDEVGEQSIYKDGQDQNKDKENKDKDQEKNDEMVVKIPIVEYEQEVNQNEVTRQTTLKEGKDRKKRKAKKDEKEEHHDLFIKNLLGIAAPISAKVQMLKEPEKLNLTFWEYVRSYTWKSEEINEKISVLREGKRRIEERLDIFGVFKKLREMDKLKLLLLENEQLILFDGLPKPELKSKYCRTSARAASLSQHLLKEAKFIHERGKNDLVALSYANLKKKAVSSPIDQKLLDIYENV